MPHPISRLGVRILKVLAALYLLLSITFAAKLAFMHFSLPMDFGSFLASGAEALAGNDPYTYDHEFVFQVPIKAFRLVIPSPNLNPPISVLPFQLLAATGISLFVGSVAWKIFSLVSYVFILVYLIRRYPKSGNFMIFFWALCLAGFWQTVEVGQIYIPLLFAAILAWEHLEKQNWIVAGIFIGVLIAIKPQFVLWPIFLLLRDRKSVFFSSAITAFILSLIPVFFLGVDIYPQWLNAIREYDGILLPGNISMQSVFTRLGSQGASLGATIILLAFMLVFTKLAKPTIAKTSILSILTILLVSPYSWSGYTLFLLPAFFSRRKWAWKLKISAGLLAFPFAFVLEYFTRNIFFFLVFGWVYGWAVVFFLWNEFEEILKNRAPKSSKTQSIQVGSLSGVDTRNATITNNDQTK
jgi:hypothetical protein